MAYIEKATEAKMKLEFDNGLTADGKQKKLSKTISKLNPTATNDVIGQTSKIISALVTAPVLTTKKILEVEIVEQA